MFLFQNLKNTKTELYPTIGANYTYGLKNKVPIYDREMTLRLQTFLTGLLGLLLAAPLAFAPVGVKAGSGFLDAM